MVMLTGAGSVELIRQDLVKREHGAGPQRKNKLDRGATKAPFWLA
jgi:hypothetical protein